MSFSRPLLCGALILSSISSAFALDAFSNFVDPSLGIGTYNSNFYYSVGPNPLQTDARVSARFTATGTGTLTGLTFGLNADTPDAVPVLIKLFADDANVEGTFLGSWEGISSGFETASNQHPLASVAAMGANFVSGTSYWLSIERRVTNDLTANWHMAWANDSRMHTVRTTPSGVVDEYSLGPVPSFSVQVQAVPEPATMAVLLPALVLLRRRHRA